MLPDAIVRSDRTAGYLDQLYRGNERLRSPQTRQYTLGYEFKYRRLISKTGVGYKRVVDEIDQTWTNEEIDGRQYKVFKWLNSASSYSLGLSENLGWRGKVITANLGVAYNSRVVSPTATEPSRTASTGN